MMIKDRGLIIKQIPYSDNSRILRCFTLNKGLLTLFARIPKKSTIRGLLQTGSFIQFSANKKNESSLYSLTEAKWDDNIPSNQISLEANNSWIFTLEILHKSLAEELPLPHLHERLYRYYAHLLYEEVSLDPLISLLNIAGTLGVIDIHGLNQLLPQSVINDLNKLNWELKTHQYKEVPRNQVFNTELDRFMKHFNISNLESLYLVE